MPTIVELQKRLKALADQHTRELGAVATRFDEAASALYKHLPATAKGEGLYSQLGRSLAGIVEQARSDARTLGAAHVLAEVHALAPKASGVVSVPLGSDPKFADVAEYIGNAVDAAREAVAKAGADDAAEAFTGTAYRAHTIIESETTNSYRVAREEAHEWLASLPTKQTVAMGFVVAKHEEDFRSARAETRDGDTTWLPIIGERWSASSSACSKCSAADGEMRPIGFSFSLPGPTAHARCQCVRSLWALAVPLDEFRSMTAIERDAAYMSQTRDGPDELPFLRAYTPEEDRAATSVNEEARTVEVVASTEALDSFDTKFTTAGWDLARYNRNPILLSCHNSRDTKMILGTAECRIEGKKLLATLKFLPEGMSEEADRVFALFKMRVLRGVSVGFQPKEWEDHEEDSGPNGRKRYVRVFKKQELVELSAVPVPSNPEALARAMKHYKQFDMTPPWEAKEKSVSEEANNAAAMLQRKAHAMTDNENVVVLPPEIAAVLQVATVDEAVSELSKREVHIDELERKVEALESAAKTIAEQWQVKVDAEKTRADAAEKSLSDMRQAEAKAYVSMLEFKSDKAREAAERLAIADLESFREAHPLPDKEAAPMAHLLKQVLPNDPPAPVQRALESKSAKGKANAKHEIDPISAEAFRLMKEEKLPHQEAFARAHLNVSAQMAKKSAH